MFHCNGRRLFADVAPEPNNGRWLPVTARIDQGRLHSSASIRVGVRVCQIRRIHQGEQVAGGSGHRCRWGCGGEDCFAVGFGKGPETSRGVPVGAPDPVTKDFVDRVRKRMARSGREDQVRSGGSARSDGRERLRHPRTPLGRSTLGTRRLRRRIKQHQAPHLQCPISKPRFKGCVHSWPRCRVFARIVTHQCGWLGCRVGEATNPGPPRLIRRVLSVASSSDNEPLVRPSGGRCVVPRLQSPRGVLLDASVSAVCTPSSVAHQNRFAELSMNETVLSAQAAVAGSVRATPADTGGLGPDRFFSLARDSDNEQLREPRETIVHHSCSDTESVSAIRNRRRRLRLRWNSAIEQTCHSVATLIDPPGSHDQSFARVRLAMPRSEGWTAINDKSRMQRISFVLLCPGWDR